MTEKIVASRSFLINRLVIDLTAGLRKTPIQTATELFIQCATTAAKKTLDSKARSFYELARLAGKQNWRIRNLGIGTVTCQESQKLVEAIRQLPQRYSRAGIRFLSLKPGEQIHEIGSLILTMAIFFSVAGGLDLEGGAPDLDIAVQGIGSHRNLFSHSIFLGIGLEFSARFALELLKNILPTLPKSKYGRWDRVTEIIEKNEERGVAAMWAGIGAHLFKDSALILGGLKPYSGLPFSMPVTIHQGLYAANGIACEAFAWNSNR